MLVFDDAEIFWISLIKNGCEYYADYKIGELSKTGKKSNLSSLGCDVYSWQELQLFVRNKEADIVLNGNTIFELEFQQDFGRLVDIIYTFNTLGSVDYINLSGPDGKTVFQDDFSY